ncbi:MAG: hypothetical protein J6D03_00330 [Clostridia bacterium]|nr:hypothetical protein [Clostridia bacterium]
MKVIFNNIIPFKGFSAINIFGILFVRKKYSAASTNYMNRLINHESIHTEQMKDFARFLPKFIQTFVGGIFFYIIYLIEWLFRILFTKDRFTHKAYRSISFEREAYENENDFLYIANRKSFNQWR